MLLPYATDVKRTSFPWCTLALILLCTLGLYLEYHVGFRDVIVEYGFIPGEPSLLTVVTSIFLHGDPVHLAGNMLALWVFGTVVEDRLGPLVYSLLFLAGGIAAALTHAVMAYAFVPTSMETPCVGASGAIFAIMGFFGVRFYGDRVWVIAFVPRPLVFKTSSLIVTGIFVAWNLFFGILMLAADVGGGVAYWAHLGGAAFGIALALIMRMHREAAREYGDPSPAPVPPDRRRSLSELEAAVARQPHDEALRIALIERLVALRAHERAYAHLRELVLAYVRSERRGEVPELIARFGPAEFLETLAPSDLYAVALAYEEAGQLDQALDLLHRVCVRAPGSPDAEMATIRAGNLLLDRLNQPSRAAEVFRYFLQAFPDSLWRDFAQEQLRRCGAAPPGSG